MCIFLPAPPIKTTSSAQAMTAQTILAHHHGSGGSGGAGESTGTTPEDGSLNIGVFTVGADFNVSGATALELSSTAGAGGRRGLWSFVFRRLARRRRRRAKGAMQEASPSTIPARSSFPATAPGPLRFRRHRPPEGPASGTQGYGGTRAAGSAANSIYLNLSGSLSGSSITTTGDDSAYGVESVAQGGAGGAGGSVTYAVTGGSGGAGGPGGQGDTHGVTVNSTASTTITTSGQGSAGVFLGTDGAGAGGYVSGTETSAALGLAGAARAAGRAMRRSWSAARSTSPPTAAGPTA